MSCGVGHRRGLDMALLWPWHRLAAEPLIQPLAWEFPHAAGGALKRKKKISVGIPGQKKLFFFKDPNASQLVTWPLARTLESSLPPTPSPFP